MKLKKHRSRLHARLRAHVRRHRRRRRSPATRSRSASSPTCPACTPTSTAQAGAEAIQMAIADMGGTVTGKKIEVRLRRPPEQARHRRHQGARVVRHPGRRHADRRHQLGHQPGDGQGRGGEEEALHLDRRRDLGADQRAVLALHRALRLRHRRARQGHRQRGRQGGRQELVLPDRRLRLRHSAAERHHDGRQGRRRHGGRLGASTRCRRATSRRSCCRRRAARRRSSAWPMPAATPSTRSRRPTSSASPRR